ncbi:hypothetical protein [Streptomyces sp. VRA16 Mangrove soil]|uniref:hypothetical protein n=1 Tax=Streptomyces sp. VRA16 Mangrove soil TaxID=2817434 RepID=UPI001A9DB4D7|nr:hypothetical protein [Streptomyces sp. VRA16 Mangrove soil]MBO1330966.1 hypothetical protein [Streptomyces sp. VRA16 Mangrove soil]
MIRSDSRLVQTAVIGGPGSGRPIILPTDADELALWRRRHPSYTYWCGTQLGGCGHELSDRLYRDKVCHFAHHPHTTCLRVATGESSADHLFIRDDLATWSGRRGLKGSTTLRNLGTGPGDAVDFRARGTRQHVRFQFSRIAYGQWRETSTLLGRETATLDWVFGAGSAHQEIMEELYDSHGHVLRFRFETVGAVRRAQVRAEDPRKSTPWASLNDCLMGPNGLQVPGAERRRRVVARPAALSDVRQRPLVQRSLEARTRAAREALLTTARHRTRTTWESLARTAGEDLLDLGLADRIGLLVAVDSDAGRSGAPVLSALLRTNEGEPPPYVADVVTFLGLGTPATSAILKHWCQREADRAYAVHGATSRRAPARLDLTEDGQIAAPKSEPSQTRTIVHVPGRAVPRPPVRTVTGAAGGAVRLSDAELRHSLRGLRQRGKPRQAAALVKEAEDALSRLPAPQRRQLQDEIEVTRRWLGSSLGLRKSRSGRRAESSSTARQPAAKKQAKKQAKPSGGSKSKAAGARPLPGVETAPAMPGSSRRKRRKRSS